MLESRIMRAILRLSVGNTRLFRNTIGSGMVGQHVRLEDGSVLFPRPSRVTFGLGKGTSDLVGWKVVTITPEHVGKLMAQFVALEVKQPKGRASAEQKAFIDTVNLHGGRAGIVRSVEDAQELLK
jgi:VRR-NUC domain